MEWLIKRLIKVGGGMFILLQPSPWPDTTKLCSGEGQEILIDGGAHGEVRSKTGIIALFQQRNDAFASVESSRTRNGAFSGSGEPYRDRIPRQTPWIGKTAA